MCGCPLVQYQRDGHRPGCWLADAETIAVEAYTAPEHADQLVAMLTALTEAGYLRRPARRLVVAPCAPAGAGAPGTGPPAARRGRRVSRQSARRRRVCRSRSRWTPRLDALAERLVQETESYLRERST